jgi:carbonic anhydrase
MVTAERALKELIDGNDKYVRDIASEGMNSEERGGLVSGQEPYAIILSCADSRVVPEAIFDADLGEIFVIRVAGNIANMSSIASIEYAVAHLGTKLIAVMGHENCGAVTAAIAGGDNGPNINHLCNHITPAIEASASSEVNDVVKVNAQLTAKELVSQSSIIEGALNDGLKIVSAYYNLSSGKVDFIEG